MTQTASNANAAALIASYVPKPLRGLARKAKGWVRSLNLKSPLVRNESAQRLITDHAIDSYEALITNKLAEYPQNRALALAQSVGSLDMETFRIQGDGHVQVLRHVGLQDGMTIYDLGCGCGRTAQALLRSGWKGRYIGADIISRLVDELKDKCPGYEAHTHKQLTLVAGNEELDMVFHWSVFTHLFPEECFLYMKDCYRALKPGGKLIFSFLEMEAPHQDRIFDDRVALFERNLPTPHLDTYLHRDWIVKWAARLGFIDVHFTDGEDQTHHMPFWQSLVVMTKT